MNVSGVCCSTTGVDPTNSTNPWQQRLQEFRALQAALNSGDLSAAQKAFSALQQSNSTGSSGTGTASTPQSGPLSKDFQALQSALQSGDLSGAQQAFSTLRQDLRSARRAHRANDGDADDQSSTQPASSTTAASASNQTTQAAKDLATLRSALQSGDLTSAQQAFAAYQQDVQKAGATHHHHHHHHSEAGSTGSTGASSTQATNGALASNGSSSTPQSMTEESIAISLNVLA